MLDRQKLPPRELPCMMRFTSVVLAVAFAAVANAHFQLQYPLPRGPFVSAAEVGFCDGYTNATQNRTIFPISDGVINLKSGHPSWTVGVIISTIQNPTSFVDFNSSAGYQLAVPFFQSNGTQRYCFPINIAASGVSGVQEGANVTIQVIYNGGDQPLYQCADLTLSASAVLPSNATFNCTNITATTTASSPQTTPSSAAGKNIVMITGVSAVVLAGLVSFL
ncbi:hypothetical protein HD554DRAFT_1336551 [Boletus coccyginus]|nr:hypothetical protein HD554DRAFT_1336551 [Boletus coccyginus]